MTTLQQETTSSAAHRRRGSALVELAASITLMATFLTGAWEFGRAFFIYNRLQSVVRDGARYAAAAAYDSPSGTAFHARVQKMTVYGDPNAASNATPLVPDLTTSQVTVTEEKSGAMPKRILVQITNYQLNNFFVRYTFSNKPRCKFDYAGQLLTP
jgi:Flp pilus assembly protein TadG